MTVVILTPEEAAERLKMSKKTVLRMIRTGQLKATKIRNRWRVDENAIGELMKEKNPIIRKQKAPTENQ